VAHESSPERPQTRAVLGRGTDEDAPIAQRIRNAYFEKPRLNQVYVFEHWFDWMRPYIRQDDRILELGSAHGLSREFLPYPQLELSDVDAYPWCDHVLDACHMPEIADNTYDVVFSQSVLHHLNSPLRALREIVRILKPGGYYLVEDVKASWMMRLMLRITGIEDTDFSVDVFDETKPACPQSAFEGNNAIVDLLMKDVARLEHELHTLRVIDTYPTDCLLLLNSGGTTSFFPYVPLTRPLLSAVAQLDRFLCWVAPGVFALHQRIVFQETTT